MLTSAQKKAYDRDGFLDYGRLLDDHAIEALRSCAGEIGSGKFAFPDELIRWQPESDGVSLADKPPEDRIYQIRYPHRHHPAFLEHAQNPRILDVVEFLLGSDFALYNTQVIFKPPYHGTDVPWHQDSAYWPIDPPNLISCWVALDESTDDNGAMRFIPGSHKQGLVDHDAGRSLSNASGGTSATVMQATVDESLAVSTPMPAGHCSFHHSLTLHNTLPNKTPTRRRAVISHYMPTDCRYTGPIDDKPKFLWLRGRGGKIRDDRL
jgi:ectoine hydroxylase-related dioxygenase (phytanoyl-CoA dioxygenase family)